MPRTHCWIFALVPLILLGCAPDRSPITGASVRGTVRYKNAPVTGGTIRLIGISDANLSMMGQIDGNGEFFVPNAPLGEVKVVIETESAKRDLRKLLKDAPPGTVTLSEAPPLKHMKIDPRYEDPSKTDVRITVGPGEQIQDIHLR